MENIFLVNSQDFDESPESQNFPGASINLPQFSFYDDANDEYEVEMEVPREWSGGLEENLMQSDQPEINPSTSNATYRSRRDTDTTCASSITNMFDDASQLELNFYKNLCQNQLDLLKQHVDPEVLMTLPSQVFPVVQPTPPDELIPGEILFIPRIYIIKWRFQQQLSFISTNFTLNQFSQ
jgi:hypothetical protein